VQGTPLGEARRLRYFSIICYYLKDKKEVDDVFFTEFLLKKLGSFNIKLEKFKRTTGPMRTPAVIRNYISYSKWINLLKKEGHILVPNGYTIYFASIFNSNSFELTTKEKLSYFIFFLKIPSFKKFLCNLKNKSTAKDYFYLDYDEHMAETYLEWCVDLDIMTTYSKKFGKFYLNSKFLNFSYLCQDIFPEEVIIQKYASLILNQEIQISSNISNEVLWNNGMISLNKTMAYTKSELDEKLHSALPMIFDLQIEIIIKYNRIIPLKELINRMEVFSRNNNTEFKWDFLLDGGFIKLGG
jgi:hypothetical protein